MSVTLGGSSIPRLLPKPARELTAAPLSSLVHASFFPTLFCGLFRPEACMRKEISGIECPATMHAVPNGRPVVHAAPKGQPVVG